MTASIKPLDALHATKKTSALCTVLFKKKKKTSHFFKTVFINSFLNVTKMVYGKERMFIVLHSVNQEDSFAAQSHLNNFTSEIITVRGYPYDFSLLHIYSFA